MKKAFTLVELLVSISIIAILAAVLLPNFIGARQKASDSQKIQDMTSIKNALRLYYNDYQTYPTSPAGWRVDLDTVLTSYLTPTGIGFTYCQTGSGDGFLLYAHLDSTQGSDITDSQTRCGVGTPVCGAGSEALANNLYFICTK